MYDIKKTVFIPKEEYKNNVGDKMLEVKLYDKQFITNVFYLSAKKRYKEGFYFGRKHEDGRVPIISVDWTGQFYDIDRELGLYVHKAHLSIYRHHAVSICSETTNNIIGYETNTFFFDTELDAWMFVRTLKEKFNLKKCKDGIEKEKLKEQREQNGGIPVCYDDWIDFIGKLKIEMPKHVIGK